MWLVEAIQESKTVDHFYLPMEKPNPVLSLHISSQINTIQVISSLNGFRMCIYSQYYAVLCCEKSPTPSRFSKFGRFWINKYVNK